MTKYKQDFRTCNGSIKGICSHCGGKLEPIETVDNSGDPTFWAGCKQCNRFEHVGTDPKVYEIAKKMVEERGFHYYGYIPENDSDDIKRYNNMCQISGACGVVRDVLYFSQLSVLL